MPNACMYAFHWIHPCMASKAEQGCSYCTNDDCTSRKHFLILQNSRVQPHCNNACCMLVAPSETSSWWRLLILSKKQQIIVTSKHKKDSKISMCDYYQQTASYHVMVTHIDRKKSRCGYLAGRGVIAATNSPSGRYEGCRRLRAGAVRRHGVFDSLAARELLELTIVRAVRAGCARAHLVEDRVAVAALESAELSACGCECMLVHAVCAAARMYHISCGPSCGYM
jgi:hypothetical protein